MTYHRAIHNNTPSNAGPRRIANTAAKLLLLAVAVAELELGILARVAKHLLADVAALTFRTVAAERRKIQADSLLAAAREDPALPFLHAGVAPAAANQLVAGVASGRLEIAVLAFVPASKRLLVAVAPFAVKASV